MVEYWKSIDEWKTKQDVIEALKWYEEWYNIKRLSKMASYVLGFIRGQRDD